MKDVMEPIKTIVPEVQAVPKSGGLFSNFLAKVQEKLPVPQSKTEKEKALLKIVAKEKESPEKIQIEKKVEEIKEDKPSTTGGMLFSKSGLFSSVSSSNSENPFLSFGKFSIIIHSSKEKPRKTKKKNQKEFCLHQVRFNQKSHPKGYLHLDVSLKM